MKKINALSFLTQEERDATEKLLQSVSISDNRNTVTKFLTNFEQVILKKIIMYNYSDMSIDFFGGTADAERKKAKIIANEYYDLDYEITCLRANYNNKFDKNIKKFNKIKTYKKPVIIAIFYVAIIFF